MIEVALVFNKRGETLHWHLPPGRTGGAIPDSRDLWQILWDNREHLGGVAHTHPWRGKAWPSQTDVTTWEAVEKGLGKHLLWPVVTFTEVKYFVWNVVTETFVLADPKSITVDLEFEELRRLSRSPDASPE